MGQKNDRRVSRATENLPDYSRDDTVAAALDAIYEEDIGVGYSEVTYITNVFTSKIESWADNTKTLLRTEVNFTYAPLPFVQTIVKDYFLDDGTTIHFKATTTILYNANKTVNSIETITQKLAGN